MTQPKRTYAGWIFYEEYKDKDTFKPQGTCLAVKLHTTHIKNTILHTEGIAMQRNGTVTPQSINIDYIYDYCAKVTQDYAFDVSPALHAYLKNTGAPTIRTPKTRRHTPA